MSRIAENPYTTIPTFVKDEALSAREGETMHKVGGLDRGDYHIDHAVILMTRLIDKFLDNAQESGFNRDEVKTLLTDALR